MPKTLFLLAATFSPISPTKMSDIPTDLYREILIKIPAEPLLRFRSVCKAWLSMIDDPAFVNSHLSLHRHRQSDGVQLIMRTDRGKLHSFSLDSFKITEIYSKHIEGRKINNLLRRGLPLIPTLPLPSCNGLILIARNKVWALRNPFTRESLELPERITVNIEKSGSYSVGLGYDLTTNDYKVVSIVKCHDDQRIWLETFVYTLKSGKWRKIEDLSFCGAPSDNSHGVYLNGSLYWICCQIGCSHYFLIAFDLGTESYKVMQLPENVTGVSPFYYDNNFVLDVLGGSLFLSRYYSCYYFGLWMIEVDGERANYKRLFSSNDYMVLPRAVAYCNKEMMVLINYNEKQFVWFDIKKRSLQKFTIFTTYRYLTSQVFQPSLFRLKDWGGVDGSNVARETTNRKRKRPSDELDLALQPGWF